MDNLTDDEKRLLRLFRCLDSRGKDKVLIETALRLLRVTPIGNHYFSRNPVQDKLEELADPIAERLYGMMPYDSYLTDLHDYDYQVAEIAWEVEDEAVDVLLGTSKYDKEVANHLVEVYLEGANEFSIPLPTEFGATEDEMMADLKDEALEFINAWREKILNTIEERRGSKQGDPDL
ncbi:hypothetical protein C6503_16165 [Candidatus Poribacteria bacterium]|nr:MAG: hypothetical protein C6503_16165 [Candidatus Poribacteria bacterium]